MATISRPHGHEAHEPLTRTWQRPAGIIGWLSAVNHRTVGMRYIATAFIFFIIAGILALLIRIQLLFPGMTFLDADTYNEVFTMHGTTMMFLFAVPVMEGVGIYLVPLMIGCRDMAFPRLNQFGYFVYLLAGISLYTGFLLGDAPDGGWFAYVPLTGPEYSPGLGMDFWTASVTFLEIAALTAAIELIVTIFRMRAPGMSLNRMPLFVWAILVMAFMIIFAMPPLMLASVFLMTDRLVGTDFFNPAAGGDPILWQHVFWFFGHPEVYIIFIPALGMVSAIVATFARREIVAYTLTALSIVAIGFISFGLWVHHMFTTGLPWLGLGFFAAASTMIAIPSGIQIFAWIATILTGRLVFSTPFLYIIGFFAIFVIGGITGVMVASVPFDLQVHDSYFVVAHFHYVLIGGAVFPLLGAIYYWFPKMSGKMLDERLGRIGFWLTFIGFNVTFGTMHITGLLGMPRRVYTYQDGLGWNTLNLISSIGAFVLALGFIIFFADVILALVRGKPAGDNPWGGGTLEWATSSPPAQYNFAAIPIVHNRHPLWDTTGTGPPVVLTAADLESVGETVHERRETLGTTMMDAQPDARYILPGPTLWPFATALAVGVVFLSTLISLWIVPFGLVLTLIGVVGWLYPTREERQRLKERDR